MIGGMVRWYFVGLALSMFGTSAMYLIPGVWVKTLTGSDQLAAFASFAAYAPTLLAPLLGYVADGVRRRPLLIWTDLAMALTLASLFLVDGPEQIWLIFAVMFVYGAKAVLVSAAEPALLVAMLPPDRLARVNGLRMSLQEGMKLVAPLVGAALFATAGAHSVVALDAATFLLAGVATMMVRVDEPPPQPRERGGLKLLFGTPELVWPMAGAALAMFAAGLHSAAVYPLIDHGLHRAPEFLGVLAAAQGAGSVVAGLLAARVTGMRAVTLGLVLVGAGALLRVTGWLPAVLAGSVLHGLGLAWAVIAAATIVQLRTPNNLLGRVSATATSVVFTATPLAMALGAWLVGFATYQQIYADAAVLTLVGAVVAARGGRTRRFTARKAPARTTDQME